MENTYSYRGDPPVERGKQGLTPTPFHNVWSKRVLPHLGENEATNEIWTQMRTSSGLA